VAATTLVRDVLQRVTSQLQDDTPQFRRWAELDLTNALQDGQQAIVTFLPAACADFFSIKLRPGTLQQVDTLTTADVLTPAGVAPAASLYANSLLDLICLMGTNGLTVGRALRRVNRDLLDLHSPDWHMLTGPTPREWTFDPQTPQHFFVNPGIPASGGPWWVRAKLAMNPAKITPGAPRNGTARYDSAGAGAGAADRISLDDEYIEPLVNYVVARANLMDQDFANAGKAQAFTTLFMSWLNAKITSITGNNPNLKALPLAPAPLARAS
jgi:hypothetical protein